MQIALILFSSAFAVASAGVLSVVPISYILNPLPSYNHVQNTFTGEYAYNYAGGPSSKEEIKTVDGVTRGAYNYIDGFGVVQSANYVADKNGFRVAATNIPTDAKIGVNVPFETPEVQAAKEAHFAEHAKAVAALGRRKRSLGFPVSAAAVSTQYHNEEKETVKIETPQVYHRQYLTVPVTPDVPPHTYASYVEEHLPLAVSHQNRIQTHNSVRVETPASASPNYVGLTATPVAAVEVARAIPDQVISYLEVPTAAHVATVSSVPTAVSSQSRYQVHSGNKLEIETPVGFSSAPIVPVAPANDHETDTVIVDAFGAAAAPVSAAIPTAVSSQSRTQVHTDSRVELDAPFVDSALPTQVVDSYGHPALPVSSHALYAGQNVQLSAPVYGYSSHLVSQVPLDTPEVAAAKREHAKAYAAELAKHQGW